MECTTVATPAPLRRVLSIRTPSYVGGPRNEMTISEPEALQVQQLINFLKLQAQRPLKSIKPAGRSGFLGSVCGTCMSQVMSLAATTGLPHFLHQLSLQRSFWPLKQQTGASALNRLLCCQNCIGIASATPSPVPLAHHGQAVCISPSSFDTF